MNNLMVDIETMGNGSNAAIISIGAVFFDESNLGKEFYSQVNLETSISIGLEIDPSTILWWLKQSDTARNAFNNNENALSIQKCLILLSEFINKETKNPIIWGNGATFDNVILSNAYKKSGIKKPWHFANDRCYRTLKNLIQVDIPENIGTAHNALDDAKFQALHMIKILRKLYDL